jgi:hypothetical protein
VQATQQSLFYSPAYCSKQAFQYKALIECKKRLKLVSSATPQTNKFFAKMKSRFQKLTVIVVNVVIFT